MKTIQELDFGYSDAINYGQRRNKDLFNQIFVRNSYLDDIILSSKYYIIGDKGTGKTAYAMYIKNTFYGDTVADLQYINNTDYEKFYTLKQRHHLDISNYSDIWTTILLVLICDLIQKNKSCVSEKSKVVVSKIHDLIDDYYSNAFNPEIITAIKIVDDVAGGLKLATKYFGGRWSQSKNTETNGNQWQMDLYRLTRLFCDMVAKIKLNKNVILFVDGIDVRPQEFPYREYIECVKGLENACWKLNTNIFSNIKDSLGQLKIVLLLRPDIFSALNLQNSFNKLRDNSVYLDWTTTITEYNHSKLFNVAVRLLSHGQNEIQNIWEKYFNWGKNKLAQANNCTNSFVEFLNISLSRPRDILVILDELKRIMIEWSKGNMSTFEYEAYNSDLFQNAYSEYFLGSLQDQLLFYYSQEDFSLLRAFFTFAPGEYFLFEDFKEMYKNFEDYILDHAKSDIPPYMSSAKEFLQLLYNSNIIVAYERSSEQFSLFHSSYREKSLTNLIPEVPIGENIRYRFHYGLYKKAKQGRF